MSSILPAPGPSSVNLRPPEADPQLQDADVSSVETYLTSVTDGTRTPLSTPPCRSIINTNVRARPSSLISSDGNPSQRKRRNIVLLLDGTGKEFCNKNSNLIKLHTVLKADDDQLIYYSSGLGTILPSSSGSWANIRRKAAMAIDLALAWRVTFLANFDDFVCDAYAYLMDYYTSGDHVYIFGYSRGAYVARALAGMIQKVGLLPRGNHRSIKTAYRVYTDRRGVKGEWPGDGSNQAGALYRRIFSLSRPVVIEFLGAWDTVSSLGGIGLPRLPFAQGVRGVKFFRQALALDERRIRFTPEFIHYDQEQNRIWFDIKTLEKLVAKHEKDGDMAARDEAQVLLDSARSELEERFPSMALSTLGLIQRRRIDCWFMGSHADVGGGSDLNGDDSLSNIPFRWMVREAIDSGILLSAAGMRYLSAMAMPMLPTGFNHNEVHGPRPETMERLWRLGEIVDEALTNPEHEQDLLTEVDTLRNNIPQDELRKLACLAAHRDVCAGPPVIDNTRPVQESLKGVWWILECLPLKTRRYAPVGGTIETESKWSVNFGAPRQIVPGQRVHKSVYRRMTAHGKYDVPMYRPRAKLTDDFGSWEDAIAAGPTHPLWRD
ncbi:hypothetical protein CspeluHIS016_0100370 [Cutaneotrichosporon spelunceum]|uniref:T6SS Phospholipase effector Tle1-like catalytic domain-containing protein n=1 Tax=Cutaneotrichosporon spelunceum TaxID=1672016 RepID=A0AAD3Y7F0_9TREE|nr:hypothetical protein CspeluHIS016_0100370 [Cutaneotrichosporon spelunceum]